MKDGPFEILDVTDKARMDELVESFKPDTMMHMVALLSATAEKSIIRVGLKYGWFNECIRSST